MSAGEGNWNIVIDNFAEVYDDDDAHPESSLYVNEVPGFGATATINAPTGRIMKPRVESARNALAALKVSTDVVGIPNFEWSGLTTIVYNQITSKKDDPHYFIKLVAQHDTHKQFPKFKQYLEHDAVKQQANKFKRGDAFADTMLPTEMNGLFDFAKTNAQLKADQSSHAKNLQGTPQAALFNDMLRDLGSSAQVPTVPGQTRTEVAANLSAFAARGRDVYVDALGGGVGGGAGDLPHYASDASLDQSMLNDIRNCASVENLKKFKAYLDSHLKDGKMEDLLYNTYCHHLHERLTHLAASRGGTSFNPGISDVASERILKNHLQRARAPPPDGRGFSSLANLGYGTSPLNTDQIALQSYGHDFVAVSANLFDQDGHNPSPDFQTPDLQLGKRTRSSFIDTPMPQLTQDALLAKIGLVQTLLRPVGVDVDIQVIAAVLKDVAGYDPHVAAVIISDIIPAMNDPSWKHKVLQVVKNIFELKSDLTLLELRDFCKSPSLLDREPVTRKDSNTVTVREAKTFCMTNQISSVEVGSEALLRCGHDGDDLEAATLAKAMDGMPEQDYDSCQRAYAACVDIFDDVDFIKSCPELLSSFGVLSSIIANKNEVVEVSD